MSKKSIKHEFIAKLMDGEINLDDRLNIAYGALISPDFPVAGKEQTIIDWFPDCLKSNDKNSKNILKSLIKCLKSDCLSTFNETLDATKLIEGLSQLNKNKKNKHNKALISCLLMILKNSGFQRHCRFEIQPFIEALLLALELLTNSASKDSSIDSCGAHIESTLDELLEDLHNVFKSTQQREELKIHMVEDVFSSLLLFSPNYDFKNSPRFQILMEEVVIGEEMEVLNNLFKTNVKGKIPFHLKGVLKLLNEDGANNIPVLLVPLLFETCVKASSNNKTGREIRFTSLLYSLISFVGFKLQLPYETVETCYKTGTMLEVLRELMSVLHRHNISTSTEAEEGLLGDVLVNLLKQMITGEYDITPDLLQAVQSVFKVYPDSARIVFRPFLKNIMFRTKDSVVMKAYDAVLTDVIRIFFDLNQIEKFFNLFLEGSVVLAKDRDFLDMSNKMVLSRGFFSVLTEKLPSLTGNQLNTILGRLEKIFSKELLLKFEQQTFTEKNFSVLMNLWVDVLCHILENSCLAVSTRWNIISETINKLAEAVQKFGHEITKSDELGLHLYDFLRSVRVLADVEGLITHYVVSLSSTKLLPRVKCKDKLKSVHNLSKSHGFLSPSEWNRVAENVMDSWHVKLKHCWFDLLAQKLSRRKDPEVMTYLVLNAGSDWLWQNLTMLSGSVPLKHLELFTEHLFGDDCFHSDDDFNEKLSLLQSMSIMSHRDLRLAVSLQCMKQMSKTLPDKHALTRNMMKLTDISSVIKCEAVLAHAVSVVEEEENAPVTTEALVEVMNKCVWEERDAAEELAGGARTRVLRLLCVLCSMNIYGFKTVTKRAICTTLMGLSYDLRKEDDILSVVLGIITGCLDEPSSVLADSLDRRVLLMWLSTVVPAGYSLRQSLSRLAVLKVIHSLDQGVEGMSQLLQSDHTLLTAILEAVVQVQGNKSFKGKEEFLKLVKTLVGLASPIVTKKPRAKLLRLYTVAVQAELLYLKNKSPVLMECLRDYLELLFEQFEEHPVTERNVAELINLVLSEKVELDSGVKEFVFCSMTKELCKTDMCPMLIHRATVKCFLEAVPSQRFEQVLDSVYENQCKCVSGSCKETCEFWDLVVNAQLDKDKCQYRQKILAQALSHCLPLLQTDPERYDSSVVHLLHSVSTSKSVAMTGKLLDLVLLVLGLAPTESHSQLLPECLSTLNCLLTRRSELMFDRIPAFLQRLRKFLTSLVKSACVDDHKRQFDFSLASDSVNQVTRIIKTMVDHHSKHFARTAPYLIADFLHLLVTYSVESSVKNELENCVCLLLVLCDNHGVQLLQNRQSLASTELFKVLSTHKSYKYTGKV